MSRWAVGGELINQVPLAQGGDRGGRGMLEFQGTRLEAVRRDLAWNSV